MRKLLTMKNMAWAWYAIAWVNLTLGIIRANPVSYAIAFGDFVLFAAYLKAALDTERP